jgi:RNA-directed DNA polymerase
MPFLAPALLFEEVACKHREDLLHRVLRQKVIGIPQALRVLEKWQIRGLAVRVLQSHLHLCWLLRCSPNQLEEMINNPMYREAVIRKKSGGVRRLQIPHKELKKWQGSLQFFLQSFYQIIRPSEVHGFCAQFTPYRQGVPNRSPIAENALPHVGKKWVLNIDLADFFPGITARQVREMFISLLKWPEDLANLATLLCTYRGTLPSGAPSSPVISNLVFWETDQLIRQLCKQQGVQYTRYADDLTFSGEQELSSDFCLDVICILQAQGFRVNEKKVRMKRAGRRQMVTGLVVNDRVNVPRDLMKRVRAMLFDVGKNGVVIASFRHFREVSTEREKLFLRRLWGYIQFIGQIRGAGDPKYRRFRKAFLALGYYVS